MYTDYSGYFIAEVAFVGTVILVVASVLAVYLLVNASLDTFPLPRDIEIPSLNETISDIKSKIKEQRNTLIVGLTIAAIAIKDKSNNGAYAIQFSDGSYYIGKGGPLRMYTSAMYRSIINGSFPTSFNFKWCKNDRTAFKQEYMWMVDYGYTTGNPNFYNKIWSPGRIYHLEDYGTLYSNDYLGR